MSQYLQSRLEPPNDPDPDMWIDEAIWGHRFHDEQNPWLVFLEFLNVFAHQRRIESAFEEANGFNSLKYKAAKRLYLRHLLFNNPKLKAYAEQSYSDKGLWGMWQKDINDSGVLADADFSYLKDRFSEFRDFADIVDLLRSTSIELNSNKRWTSKFVFPYGENCLYEDLDKKANTNDRRFFGRTGELLYLMICRSDKRQRLNELFSQHMFFNPSKWNKIVEALQPPMEITFSDRKGCFLPYPSHPCFNKLTEDWVKLLELRMPGYDVFPFLVLVAGFHLIQYHLRVAQDVVRIRKPFRMVCEIVAPKKTLVRELAISDYQENNQLSAQAIATFIDDIEKTDAWNQAKYSSDPFLSCKTYLEEHVKWGRKYAGANTPEALIQSLREAAKKRHKQHVANIHRVYGRDVGIVSKRGTNRLRYAPNDNLIKALIFANVDERMEFSLFLELLWERYGLVFGDKQAAETISDDEFSTKAFKSNAQRLEQRLASLGMLKRLSDGCAYVLNPFKRSTE